MNPPGGMEGELYREFKLTQPAPQGICVANSSGKALAWALMFEDDPSVLEFLDHAQERYRNFPDGSAGVATERFMRFPKHKLADVPDSGKIPKISDANLTHSDGDHCLGDLRMKENSLLGKVVGRALGADGKPLSDARTQDNYVEDRFELPESMQRAFLTAAQDANGNSFQVPAELARLVVGNAYLGMLDVNPLGGHYSGGKTTEETINLWAKPSASKSTYLVWGTSSVSAVQAPQKSKDDGRMWEHRVNLAWKGYIEIGESGLRGLSLIADGKERLLWGNRNSADVQGAGTPAVANLPGGRSIDFDGKVRYGIHAE